MLTGDKLPKLVRYQAISAISLIISIWIRLYLKTLSYPVSIDKRAAEFAPESPVMEVPYDFLMVEIFVAPSTPFEPDIWRVVYSGRIFTFRHLIHYPCSINGRLAFVADISPVECSPMDFVIIPVHMASRTPFEPYLMLHRVAWKVHSTPSSG